MNIARMLQRRQSRLLDEQNPIRRLIKILLERAIEENASAIVFGIPGDAEWDLDAQLREEREGVAEAEAWLNERDGVSNDDPSPWPPPRNGFLSYPNGLTSLPIWFVVSGEHRPQMPISLALYGATLAMIADLLVSIDDEDSYSFIEITSTTAANRRFVKVLQTMGRDNTVALEILGARDVGPGVRVRSVHSPRC